MNNRIKVPFIIVPIAFASSFAIALGINKLLRHKKESVVPVYRVERVTTENDSEEYSGLFLLNGTSRMTLNNLPIGTYRVTEETLNRKTEN